MDSSSGFGSTPRDARPLQTRFRCGSAYDWLNRPRRVTRRIILQKARRQGSLRSSPSTARKQTVSGSLSLPSPGYFSPFPHGTVRYRSLRVCSLGRWAPQLHAGFLVSGATQEPNPGERSCLLPGCHGLWRRFPDVFAYQLPSQWCTAAHPAWSSNPRCATPAGLARSPFRPPRFARRYYGDTFCSSGYMRCFSSPGALRQWRSRLYVVGLPHSEIGGSTPARGSPPLIAAMPRPSSARSAEASTLCSYCLP